MATQVDANAPAAQADRAPPAGARRDPLPAPEPRDAPSSPETSPARAEPDPRRLTRATRDKTAWDVFTHPKTRYVVGVWAPVVAILVGVSIATGASAWTLLGGTAFGILVYSFIEYLMHRYLYHWEPESRFWRTVTGDVGRRHMRHHREPERMHGAINDRQIPVMGVAAFFTAGSILLMPWPLAFGLMAIAAGISNYVLQEIVHFGTHHLPMRHPLLAALKRHHMLHHYRDWDMNYGLFWPFWDVVFGTHHTSRRQRRRMTTR